jgi:hypothetical protein
MMKISDLEGFGRVKQLWQEFQRNVNTMTPQRYIEGLNRFLNLSLAALEAGSPVLPPPEPKPKLPSWLENVPRDDSPDSLRRSIHRRGSWSIEDVEAIPTHMLQAVSYSHWTPLELKDHMKKAKVAKEQQEAKWGNKKRFRDRQK